jgi:integrase/recombinase XerC
LSATDKRQRLFTVLSRSELGGAIDAFLVDCQARALSARTVALYREKLRAVERFAQAHNLSALQDLTPDWLRRFLVQLTEHGHNPGGVHVHYRTVRTFLRWAWQEYDLPEPVPIARVRAPKVPQLQLAPVPIPDLRAMLSTCDRSFVGERDRAILLSLLDTGARSSEFLALDVQDVNMSTGAVLIRHGKGGKHRVVFLGAKARRALLRYLRRRRGEASGALWVSVQTGGRLQYHALRRAIARRAKMAGVPAPSLHSFRRAFALACLRGGMDVYSLQKLMGHADLSVLRRYLAQTEADLQEAHQRAGPVDNLL